MKAALGVLLLAPWLAGARLVVVADGDSRPYVEATAGAEPGFVVERLRITDANLAVRAQKAAADDTWLALGPRSAAWLAGLPVGHRAAALVRERELPPALAGVFLEVPPERQIRWLRTAFPGRRRLVVIRDRASAVDARLQQAAAAEGLFVVFGDAATPGEAVPAMESVLRNGNGPAVVWLLPDQGAITADSVAPLVQEALARRVPVVGFSPYFLRVGAVAAIQVDYASMGKQGVALAKGGVVVRQGPAAAHLVVDQQLAQRLGVVVSAGDGVEVRP